jgi:recombinational DNA repair ATPase RecF
MLYSQASERREELEKASAAQDRYKHLLQEYEEYLETSQNKLKADTISAPELSHLQQQLMTHKVEHLEIP